MGCLQGGSLWAIEVPLHREADTRKDILMLTMAIMQAKLTRLEYSQARNRVVWLMWTILTLLQDQ